jgi:hypothetical protein
LIEKYFIISRKDFVDKIRIMFAIPDFVNLRAKFNSFSKLINLVIRISLNGCGVIIVVFFLEDLFINGIKVLHDILFLSEFSHKLRE